MEQELHDVKAEDFLAPPDPEQEARHAKIDALFDSFPPEEAREVGRGFYIDGNREPRTRHHMLRAVPNGDS